MDHVVQQYLWKEGWQVYLDAAAHPGALASAAWPRAATFPLNRSSVFETVFVARLPDACAFSGPSGKKPVYLDAAAHPSALASAP